MFIRPSRAKTIRPKMGVYQMNTRIDPMTHERLKFLQAYYQQITGLSTNTGVIMRRAISLLTDHIDTLIQKERNSIQDSGEEAILRRCADGEEHARHYRDPMGFAEFPTWAELREAGGRPHRASSDDYDGKSLNN